MSKLYFKISRVSFLAAVLGLAACGGQELKPEEMSEIPSAEIDAVVDKTTGTKVEPEIKKQPPEPPVVEVMPRTQANDSQIAVEAIPAKAEVVKDKAVIKDPVVIEPDSKVKEQAPTKGKLLDKSLDTKVEPGTAAPPVVAPTVAPTVAAAGPNNFVVTVGMKPAGHPAYGKGHPMGFLVNGISGKELVVERGKTYSFDIATNAKHDVYLSKKAIGWGSAPYSTGVEGAYTYKGTMVFKPTKVSPDQLFYACRNHPYMGAIIHVVNPGQTVKIKPRVAADISVIKPAPKSTVSESQVKQKLMFAEMMSGAQGAKRVMSSQNAEAKQLVNMARGQIVEARNKSKEGALSAALTMADQALQMLSEATRLVPGDEELAHLAENYKTRLTEIQGYQKSHRANLKRLEKQGDVDANAAFDKKQFAEMLATAASFAKQKNYVRANKVLEQAQTIVTAALHKMLDSKTIVYDLNFETAADEYDYELKRFTGYEELIPVAIEAKKPAAGAVKLMESFLAKARKRRDEAQSKAEAGDYPMAISMMLQATKTVRRALRMVGVAQ